MTTIPQTLTEYVKHFGHAIKETSHSKGCSSLDETLWNIYQKAVQETQFESKEFCAQSLKLPLSYEDQLCLLMAKRHGLVLIDCSTGEDNSTITQAQIRLPQIDPHRFSSRRGVYFESSFAELLQRSGRKYVTNLKGNFQLIVMQGVKGGLNGLTKWKRVTQDLSKIPPGEREILLKKISREALIHWSFYLEKTTQKKDKVITHWSFTPVCSEFIPNYHRKGWEEAQKQKGTDGELCVEGQSLYFHEWLLLQEHPRFFSQLTAHPSKPDAKEFKGFSFEVLSAYLEYIYTGVIPQNLSGKTIYHLYRLGALCEDEAITQQLEELIYVGIKPNIFTELTGEWTGEMEFQTFMVKCLALGLIYDVYYNCLLSVLPSRNYEAWKTLRKKCLSDSHLQNNVLAPFVKSIYPGISTKVDKKLLQNMEKMDVKIREKYWQDYQAGASSTDITLFFPLGFKNENSFKVQAHAAIFAEEIPTLNFPSGSTAVLDWQLQNPSKTLPYILEFIYTGKFKESELSLLDTEDLFIFSVSAEYQKFEKYCLSLISQKIKGSELKNIIAKAPNWDSHDPFWVQSVLNLIENSFDGLNHLKHYLSRDSMKPIEDRAERLPRIKTLIRNKKRIESRLLKKYPSLSKKCK